jgi:3-deoxy-manno-octulosonate cytidylyltransferase (CMP-KDO synthetase)
LASGTDRVAAAAEAMPHVEIVVNVQGDEPEIEGAAIDQVIELLENDSDVQMATLATPIRDSGRLDDPACVKVVLDGGARALYFSRAAIPHARSGFESFLSADPPLFYQHIGVYAYRRSFLLRLAQTPPSRIEQIECLEQLRVLESGYAIRVGIVPAAAVGIDTPADYQAFVIRQQRTAA